LLYSRSPPISTLFPYTTLFRSDLPHVVLELVVVEIRLLRLGERGVPVLGGEGGESQNARLRVFVVDEVRLDVEDELPLHGVGARSEEHSLNSSHVKISYAVFCL